MIAAVPKVNGEYDLKALSDLAVSIKRDHPDANDASVLLEPEVEYDDMIQVMDTIRRAEVPISSVDPATRSRNATCRRVPPKAASRK